MIGIQTETPAHINPGSGLHVAWLREQIEYTAPNGPRYQQLANRLRQARLEARAFQNPEGWRSVRKVRATWAAEVSGADQGTVQNPRGTRP